MMTSFRILLERFSRHEAELDSLQHKICVKLEGKLGYGWAITGQTDGWCLLDEDSNNYKIPLNILADALKLSPQKAIETIKEYEI